MAIVRYDTKKALERARSYAKNVREKEKELVASGIQKAAMVAASAGWSELEQHIPAQVAKLPTKIWAAGLSYFAAYLIGGKAGDALIGAGDSTTSIYIYKAAYQMRAKLAEKAEKEGKGDVKGVGYIEEP